MSHKPGVNSHRLRRTSSSDDRYQNRCGDEGRRGADEPGSSQETLPFLSLKVDKDTDRVVATEESRVETERGSAVGVPPAPGQDDTIRTRGRVGRTRESWGRWFVAGEGRGPGTRHGE